MIYKKLFLTALAATSTVLSSAIASIGNVTNNSSNTIIVDGSDMHLVPIDANSTKWAGTGLDSSIFMPKHSVESIKIKDTGENYCDGHGSWWYKFDAIDVNNKVIASVCTDPTDHKLLFPTYEIDLVIEDSGSDIIVTKMSPHFQNQ